MRPLPSQGTGSKLQTPPIFQGLLQQVGIGGRLELGRVTTRVVENSVEVEPVETSKDLVKLRSPVLIQGHVLRDFLPRCSDHFLSLQIQELE